nr:hypothetical protein [uncultured Flavobacterium sp.]
MNITFDNQNEKYPIVLIPDKIFNLLHSEIDEITIASELNISKPQQIELRKPEAPSKYTYEKRETIETDSSEFIGISIVAVPIIIFLSFFVADSFLDGLKFILLAYIGYIAFFSFMMLLNGQYIVKFKTQTHYVQVTKSPQEFEKLKLEYSEKLNEYNSKIESNERIYKAELDIYSSKIDTNKNNVKKKLYLQNLKPLNNASRGSLSLKRGVAELKFLEQMDSELKSLIYADMVPRLDWHIGKKTYNPDFTLICKSTNLHIDIEIDEPYSLIEKTPIHYIGSLDDKRNDFFLENTWCVIRFSESQIIQNTTECIKTIKSIYHSIIEMNSNYSTNLNTEDRWTYEKSLIMQNNRYREKYLNKW